MADDLVAFLTARLDEDADVADRNSDGHGLSDGYPQYPTYVDSDTAAADEYVDRFGPARVLAEVDAKRRRLARHGQERRILTLVDDEGHHTLMSFYVCTWCTPGTSIGPGRPILEWPCPDIRDDATVYRAHPDYRPGWAPDAEGRSV